MKHDVKKNILKGAEKIVSAEVKKNNDTTAWCFGFFHQPKRPKKM